MSHVYQQLNFLPNTNGALSTFGNIINILTGVLWNQGFPAGLALQTYDVTVDVVLAFALAASYGLYRVLDETIVDVLPI
jgi:hypothetical protein